MSKREADAPSQAIPMSANVLAIVLAALCMLGPFAVDTYLPAFPNIQATLHATPLEVQQSLTAYMLSFSAMILWHGALSDAFGRRNVVIASLALFAVASLGCASAHSVHYLWAFRILQGVAGGAGAVISRAIIRDLYKDAPAARLLSLVTMIFSIAPAIAPILGGWIVKLLDWRSIFLFMFLYAAVLMVYCYRKLPETLAPENRQPFNPRALWTNYSEVFRSRLFHLKAGTVAFNFAGSFLYVAAAPVFITEHLGLGPDQFGWQFVPQVAGIFIGALAANRLAGKMPIPRQARIGFMLILAACVANLAYHAFFPARLPWSVAPLFVYTFGMSMVAPGATLLVLDLFPNIRGIASSCQSFVVTLLGAAIAGLAAPALWHSPMHLALGQAACALIAMAMWTGARSHTRKLARQGVPVDESLTPD